MSYTPGAKHPATDDSLMLLRRILRALEASSNADSSQRQRITLDSITSGLTLSTITTVGTVSAVTGITNALPAGTNSIGNLGGYSNNDYQIMQQRIMYNTGIRSKIS